MHIKNKSGSLDTKKFKIQPKTRAKLNKKDITYIRVPLQDRELAALPKHIETNTENKAKLENK